MTNTSFAVTSIHAETTDVKRFVLTADAGAMPVWRAGSHVRVALKDGGDRAYSLMKLPELGVDQIALGVLREAESTGGSRFLHDLQVGDRVEVSEPANHFALEDHAAPTVLIAGGIGITPILSMAVELQAAGRPYHVHYAGRTAGRLAFVPEMQAICGEALSLHYDDTAGALRISDVLKAIPSGAHVYVCGPAGMIEAIKVEVASHGGDQNRLHCELFTAASSDIADTAFDVEISSTGQIVHVSADQTIIQALEDAGLDPLYDCQRGDCGICQCDVIAGEPDHRDVILSDAEKAAGNVMQICVSRAKSAKLVLDI